VVLVVVGALALAGGVIAVLELVRGEQPAGVVREPSTGGAWQVATGFGSVAVERVQRLPGSGHSTHPQDPDGRPDEVRLRVRVDNALGRAVPYSPGQLRLRPGGAGAGTSPLEPQAGPGSIAAGDSLSQEISYLVPEGRTRLWLLVDDLTAPRPLSIALGEVPSP
jgi:hypothetical protein